MDTRRAGNGEFASMDVIFWWAAIFGALYFLVFSLVVPIP